MEASGIPTKFPLVWAEGAASGNITTPIPSTSSTLGRASLTLGFPPACFSPIAAGGSWPFGQDFNGILNEITAWNQWQQAGGPIPYDATFQSEIGGYPKGATLLASAGTHFWLSTTDNNMSDPDTGGAGWTNLSALGGVLTGTLSSAGFAANPSFSGNLSATGNITASGAASVVQGHVLQTDPTGYLNVGSGSSNIGGPLTAADGLTVSSGNMAISNGSFFISNNTYSIAIGSAGQTNLSYAGLSTGAITLTGGITSPGGGNFESGTVSAGAISGATLYGSGQISNPWFSSTAGELYTSVALVVEGTTTLNTGLTVNGGGLVATDNASVTGSLSITNGTYTGGFQCYNYGGVSAALVASVGLVAGTFGFNATAGWVLNSTGTAGYSTFSGQFGFASGEGNLQGIAFYATSDARKKKDRSTINPAEGRAFVQSVIPTSFSWIDDGKRGTGYVAQQLIASGYEHLVSVVPDEDLEESEEVFDGKTITSPAGARLIAKYDDIIALLHASNLDLYGMVEKLSARIALLEGGA